jgi:hypothetical protein
MIDVVMWLVMIDVVIWLVMIDVMWLVMIDVVMWLVLIQRVGECVDGVVIVIICNCYGETET